MLLAGGKNGHFTGKDNCKQHDRAGAWSWSNVLIMGLLSILGAACTILPAPKKKDDKTFIYCCSGAWVQALWHGKNLILSLEKGIFLLFHGFFRFSVLLTTTTTFWVTFPQYPAPLHPFLIKYLFLWVFYWVQHGCRGGCRLGAARVQVQGFFLTCTQTKERNIQYLAFGCKGAGKKRGIPLKSGNLSGKRF